MRLVVGAVVEKCSAVVAANFDAVDWVVAVAGLAVADMVYIGGLFSNWAVATRVGDHVALAS